MSTKEPAMKKLRTTNDFSSFHVENSHFESLPNEILLKIVDYLQVRGLLRCGQTCAKIRTVVQDESLWKKVNFSSESMVPTGLLQLILDHGCEYLNISQGYYCISDELLGQLTLNQDSKLKFLNLDLTFYFAVIRYRSLIFDPLLTSCHSLEKLQLTNLDLNSSLIKTICTQNSKTLKVLNLNWCTSPSSPYMQLSVVRPIIDECVGLNELIFCKTHLSEGSMDYLVKNITPKLSKLCLTNFVQDKHIEILVGRCTNLTELNLVHTGITTDSLNHIIENLQTTLEKLGLPGRFFWRPGEHFTKLFELKAMKKLTVLDLGSVLISGRDLQGKLESLTKQVPNAEIVHKAPTHGKQVVSGNFRCYE